MNESSSSSSFSSMKIEPQLINNKYKTLNKISSGSFGTVYKGKNVQTLEDVAIKLEKGSESGATLQKEYNFLKRLEGVPGVPKGFFFGYENGYNVMVMTFLSIDLATYVKKYGAINLSNALIIFKQVLETVVGVHKNGIIHRDIKPENILTSEKENIRKIYLIDFGISKNYIDNKGKHIIFVMNKSFVGTLRYASENSHKGYELSRRGLLII